VIDGHVMRPRDAAVIDIKNLTKVFQPEEMRA
jgi:hypothetical protein